MKRGTTYWDDPTPPLEWSVERRQCPFCELPGHICGCPEGERIADEEAHIIRGTE